jgi:hypothetical protein
VKDKNTYIETPTSNIRIINNKITIKKCKKTTSYTFFNKKTILQCRDIESKPGPRLSLLLNHPQEHHNKQIIYFYNKTTQMKPEYNHILEIFKPYLKCTQITTTNQHLAQFCINNNTCPESYLFYAILITLAPIPTQSNQLIAENSTQWTTNLIKNLLKSPNSLSTNPHILQKFHFENPHITKPLESIQNELYSFITTERPNMETLQQKFPYLPEKLINEALNAYNQYQTSHTPIPYKTTCP